jgi:hypothetical protein
MPFSEKISLSFVKAALTVSGVAVTATGLYTRHLLESLSAQIVIR